MPLSLDQATDFRTHYGALGSVGTPDREAALRRFEELGVPALKNEEWKYTNLRALADTAFKVRYDASFTAAEVDALPHVLEDGPRIVFVNGRLAAGLSNLTALPEGVKVASLADVVASELGTIAAVDATPFTALNAALWEDGAYIHIAKGASAELPIQAIFLTRADEPTAIHTRVLIVAENNCSAKIVESFFGEGPYLANAVTEIEVGAGAVIEHTKIQEESESAFHIATIQVLQAAASTFTSNNVGFGGKIARHDLNVVVNGEHCETSLKGAYTVFDEQTVDNHTRIDHAVPHCHSFEVYKGILGDNGTGVFNGKIYVHQDAQKTDAKQTNKALLLSPTATMNTKPQLEIFADDVKCTHGATVGQLDDDQLFYLRARGLPLVEAKTLLTFAFVGEALEKVSIAPLREALERQLMDRVRGA